MSTRKVIPTSVRRTGLQLPFPAGALRRVFEDDAAGREFVADFVGARVVFVFTGLFALRDKLFDFGVVQLRLRLVLLEDIEDTVQARDHHHRIAGVGAVDAVIIDAAIGIADEVEQHAQGPRDIEIIVEVRFPSNVSGTFSVNPAFPGRVFIAGRFVGDGPTGVASLAAVILRPRPAATGTTATRTFPSLLQSSSALGSVNYVPQTSIEEATWPGGSGLRLGPDMTTVRRWPVGARITP